MGQDLRYAYRTLAKNPGFTAIAVLTLALGIGANTAVFTLINAVLLRTMPVQRPHELVVVEAQNGVKPGIISFPMYRDLRSQNDVLTDILASAGETPLRLTIPIGNEVVELDNIRTSFVTANYFSVLGLQPVAGRVFSEDDDRNPGAGEETGSVAVISHELWERQFGRDPSVLSKTVLVRRSACRIIGIAPQGFRGEATGSNTDLWVPVVSFTSAEEVANRRAVFASYMGRLKPGVSQSQAQVALTLLFQRLAAAEPIQKTPGGAQQSSLQNFTVALTSGASGFDYGVRRTFTKPLSIIWGVTALVLFIACANVANLLLSRAASRRREIAVRMAVGCSRPRLLRQLLTESLLLSLLGAAVGVLFAYWASPLLVRMLDTGPFPLPINLRPDTSVLAFLSALTIISGIGFGIVPAWQAGRLDLTSSLKSEGRTGGKQTRQYLGRILVAAQVGLSLLLLVGASLLIRSFYKLNHVDLGFNPNQVLIFDLAHSPQDRKPEAMNRIARAVRERVTQIPGVQSASVSGLLLFGPSDVGAPIKIQDNGSSLIEPIQTRFSSVSPGFFETVGMKIVQGRAIAEQDAENAPLVAVINESFARRYFSQPSPVGKWLEISANWRSPFEAPKGRPIEIVGVVRDAKYNNLRLDAQPMFYVPIVQMPRSLRSLEVRTAEPAVAVASQVRSELLGVSKDLMVRRVIPLSEQVERTLGGERMVTTLCTFFGLIALLLASVGLYGVISYSVTQRTNEIGIRMALGATGKTVMAMILRQSLVVVGVGLFIGLTLALLLTRLLSSFLFGVSPLDPLSIGTAMLLLTLVAIGAVWVPARRATKVDPLVALRYE